MGEQDLEAAPCMDHAIMYRRFVLGLRLGRSFLVRKLLEIHPLLNVIRYPLLISSHGKNFPFGRINMIKHCNSNSLSLPN